jgi:methionine-rich copper-binding protein CopC
MRSRLAPFPFLAVALAASGALAHAFLDHASPGVGSTVSGSPGEIQISFTQDIVPAFSGISVSSAEGAGVPTGKPSVGPANVLHVSLGHALKPGVYVVNWHVTSVDTHKSGGSYKFTIAP